MRPRESHRTAARSWIVAGVVAGAALSCMFTAAAATAATRAPRISSVAPAVGATVGSQRVTITGSSFRGVEYVRFNTKHGNSLRVMSSTRIDVTAPAHRAGTVSVRVVTTHGTSAARTYRYMSPPARPYRWTSAVQMGIDEGDALYGAATALSCPSAEFCVAVGPSNGPDTENVLQMYSGGHWHFEAIPVPSDQGSNDYPPGLDAVSCASSSFCVAVGSYPISATVFNAYAATFNGTSWSAKRVGTAQNLSAVDCPAVGQCVAAGTGSASANANVVATVKDGTWSSTPLPAVPITHSSPGAVAQVVCPTSIAWCVVRSRLVLMGGRGTTSFSTGGGTTWTSTATPAPAGRTLAASLPSIHDVACIRVRSCIAAGGALGADGRHHAMIVHLAGNQIFGHLLPDPPDATGSKLVLTDASCPSSHYCTEVGTYNARLTSGGATVSRTLTVRQTPKGTRSIESPLPAAATSGGPTSVACVRAARCTGVGMYVAGGRYYPLVTTYAGGVWTPERIAGSAPTDPSSTITDLSCPALGFCAAVGRSGFGSTPQFGYLFTATPA